MHSPMLSKSRVVTKDFAIFSTFIWSLSSMHAPMLSKIITRNKGLATFCPFITVYPRYELGDVEKGLNS